MPDKPDAAAPAPSFAGEKTVIRLIAAQIIAALVLGIMIIGSVVWFGAQGLETRAFEVLQNWGGTVIGFFFGSMLGQNAKLVEALRG
jgi:hypothetical protein